MVHKATLQCLITGASGGIGQALVRTFHTAGYAVIATDITIQPAGLLCDHYIQADLARVVDDEVYASDIFNDIHECLNGIGLNALINNAAIQVLGGSDCLTRNDWRRTLDVNVIAPFLFTQAMLNALERTKGCVINISSIHARLTKKNFVAYATSKAALSGLTRSMAVDLGERNIRINAIEPAAIETDMLKAGFTGKPELYHRLEKCHPLQRIGQPEEVARLALAIVGGGIDFLNGACVRIDGGISAQLFDPD